MSTEIVKGALMDARAQFAVAFGGDKDVANKYILGVLNTVMLNDKLMECDPISIRDAAITSAVLGVAIDARQYAYLIPYNKKAQFQMSYKGYVNVAKRDPDVDNVISNIVYDGDVFGVDLGANTLSHTLTMDSPLYGTTAGIKYVYALVRFKANTGRSMMFEVMTKKQIDEIRASSKAGAKLDKFGNPTIWEKHYGEMARKTAIKRLCKHAQLGDVARIDEVDNGIEEGKIINVTPEGELKVDQTQNNLRVERDKIIELINQTTDQVELDTLFLNHSEDIEELAANNLTTEINKLQKEKKEQFYAELVISLLDECDEIDDLDRVYNNHLEMVKHLKAAVRNSVVAHYCELKQFLTDREAA